MASSNILSPNHWVLESFVQRMTTAQWRQVLLNGDDYMIFRGHLRYLKAKPLGAGVVEVTKEPREKP